MQVAVGHCVGDPFRAHVDADGKLHGRGACDTKATLALCVSLLHELQRTGTPLTTNLLSTVPGLGRHARAWCANPLA